MADTSQPRKLHFDHLWEIAQHLNQEHSRLPRYRRAHAPEARTLRVIADQDYGLMGPTLDMAEKVTLRIGAPEQVYGPRGVLPFEIVGPGEPHIEGNGVPPDAVDVVHSLQGAWSLLAAALLALEARTGGKLVFEGKEDLGLAPMPTSLPS